MGGLFYLNSLYFWKRFQYGKGTFSKLLRLDPTKLAQKQKQKKKTLTSDRVA